MPYLILLTHLALLYHPVPSLHTPCYHARRLSITPLLHPQSLIGFTLWLSFTAHSCWSQPHLRHITSGVEDHMVSKVFSTLVALPCSRVTLAIGLTGNWTPGQVKDLKGGVGDHWAAPPPQNGFQATFNGAVVFGSYSLAHFFPYCYKVMV